MSADTTQGTIWNNNSLLFFDLGPVFSGGQATLIIVATAISPGAVTNTATVSTTTSEFNLGDNQASASVSVLGTNSAPSFQSISQTGGTLALNLNVTSGQKYQLQYKTNLTQVDWNNWGTLFTATNPSTTFSDVIGLDPQRFYRVVLVP